MMMRKRKEVKKERRNGLKEKDVENGMNLKGRGDESFSGVIARETDTKIE